MDVVVGCFEISALFYSPNEVWIRFSPRSGELRPHGSSNAKRKCLWEEAARPVPPRWLELEL
jgi:hypothetical protein